MLPLLLAASSLFSLDLGPMAAGNPFEVERMLERSGPTVTVSNLVLYGQWDAIVAQMAAGDERWIALAPDLARGTGEGRGEAISTALAKALPAAPDAVVAALRSDGPTSASRVCSAQYVEPGAPALADYRRRAVAALATVSPERSAKRDRCRVMLGAR